MDMLVRKPHPMPEMAAIVAELRSAFGDTIDEAIARGKAGEPTFFASENGLTVGTRSADQYNTWVADDAVGNRRYCPGCDGQCVGTGARCSERR
jgi:hypothetical protein